jgi:hypothetical protein
MTDIQSLRQHLVSAIAELPQEALTELIAFVDYQRYKASRRADGPPKLSSPQPENGVELTAMLSLERPLYERLSPQELAQAFLEWAESHRDLALPVLSDEAIGRESIYGERG